MKISRRHFIALAPFIAQGQSRHTIVLAANASPSEQRAANELRQFLFEMTGARLPVVTERERVSGPMILLGQGAAVERLWPGIRRHDFGVEGFALKTVGEHLVIAGGRRRGTMYGVYEFLERLGCRWYTPDCSRIPKRVEIGLPPFDEMQRPAFDYRELYSTPSRNRDWAARNRTNGTHAALDESTGGKITYYPFGHSFYELVSPEKYFSSHPEYFSLTAGERRVERSQICLTNPDVIRLGIEGTLGWMEQHPEADFISLTQNDTEGWCECPNCRRVEEEEGSHSGPILRFVNAIAAEAVRKHPERMLDTFAYSYGEVPPAKVRPLANVCVRLAPIGQCQAHPYAECPRNRSFMERLKGWQQIAKHLYVWHYYTDFWQHQLPYPNLDELTADIPMYHRHGVRGMFLQADISANYPTEFGELKTYLLSKLLWNPQADAKAIIREFLGAFYGGAAGPIGEYLELTHKEVRLPPAGKGKTLWAYKSFWVGPDFLPAANAVLDKAEKAAASEVEAKRVRKARLSPDWVEVIEAKRMVLRGNTWGPADPDLFAHKFADYMKKVREQGIDTLHESSDLAGTEKEYARYTRTYRAVTIENERLRAVVIPDYLGRMISLKDLRTGREALRQPGPEEQSSNIEAMGGLILLAHKNFLSSRRHDPQWRVDSVEGHNALVLKGVCENGLEFRRRLELQPGEAVLRTFTTVTNRGKAAVKLLLQSRSEIHPGPVDQPVVGFGFRRSNGSEVRESLLPQRELFFGIEAYLGADRPDGEWRVWNSSPGITLHNRFSLEQAHICRLWWRGRGENKVNLCLWSPERTLQPGDTLALDTDYAVECG